MPQWLRHHLVIIAAASFVLFFRLGDARLWDRDEPRNAQCAREMMERHDWVVPMFNQELRTHKPVLLYWLIMSAYSVFGVGEFAARFWSAALGVGTVLCTYHLGMRLFGRGVGFWAALALAPAMMFDVAARAATPDSVLIFFVAASLTAYVHFAFDPTGKLAPSFPNLGKGPWIIYALVAMAVLAKGPVGLVMPVAIISLSLWLARDGFTIGGNLRDRVTIGISPRSLLSIGWEMKPLIAIAMLLVIALPWYAWVGLRTNGEFLTGFFWDHNVRRATEAMENHRGSPLIYYPVTILLGFFPASLFLIPSLVEAWRRRNDEHRAAVIFCATWIAVFIGVFSLAGTKLPSYVTPCYPAVALLVGRVLDRWTRRKLAISRVWLRLSLATGALVGLAAGIGLYIATSQKLPGEEWLAAIGGVLLIGCAIALILEWKFDAPLKAVGVFAGSAILFSASLMGFGAAAADRHQQSHLLLEAIRAGGDSVEVAAWGGAEPSWVFYLNHPIRELDQPTDAVAFMAKEDPNRYLLIRRQDYDVLCASQGIKPPVVARVPLFLKNDDVLLVGMPGRLAAQSPAAETLHR